MAGQGLSVQCRSLCPAPLHKIAIERNWSVGLEHTDPVYAVPLAYSTGHRNAEGEQCNEKKKSPIPSYFKHFWPLRCGSTTRFRVSCLRAILSDAPPKALPFRSGYFCARARML